MSNATLAIVAASAVLLPAAAFDGARTAAPCRSAQLGLVARHYGEAGGQFAQTFTFTNLSRRACKLAGWPSVRASAGTIRVVLGKPGEQPYRTVILQPRGGMASFDLFGADYDAAAERACPRTSALWVTPPRASPMRVAVRIPNCGLFDIAPIVAGGTDRASWSAVWHR
jgi:hypothetical protein